MEVLSIALEIVRDLLVSEAKFLGGVRNQVMEIEKELGWMQAFLKEADKRQVTDERIHNCVHEFRRLAYGIENVLDNFDIEVASRRKGRGIKKVLKRYACICDEFLALHKVGTEIEDIKTSLAKLKGSFHDYDVLPIASEDDDSNLQRQTYPDEIEECFVGMEKNIEQLVTLIIDDCENAHQVIMVHGMGGLGKTTLAQKVYNHNDVQKCFEAFAWVTITQKLDEETILKDILKRLLPESRKDSVINMGKRDLVEELRKEQKNRKCLVVLDDMWETGQWETLRPAFSLEAGKSKLLITTRNKTLLDLGFPYLLDFLSEDDGWELLKMKALGRNVPKEDAARFENIGKELVRKCGRLPLAISVLGGILVEKRSLDYWKDVSDDFDSYLTKNDKSDKEYGQTLQVLALSYNSLPYHLKPCFLHLGQFQEDEDIEVDTLCRMWIAEGMISSSHWRKKEDTLMDIAGMYLIEMANRSMVQVKPADDEDDFPLGSGIASCRLHDLWRDFCLAYGEKVEFLKILDFRKGKDLVPNFPDNNPWRYSIYMDSNKGRENAVNMAQGVANRQLRSFYICNSSSVDINLSFLQKLEFLRVLLIENCHFVDGVLPEGIKKLIHLRFLGLKKCELEKLPQWISKLQYMQTLDLREMNTIEIPNCLWKLKQLRHLLLPKDFLEEVDGELQEKVKLTGLTNLETLFGFNDQRNEIKDLSEMINLRFFWGVLRGNKSLTQFVNYNNNHLHKLRKIFLFLDYASTCDKPVVPLQDVFKCIGLRGLAIGKGDCDFMKFEAPSTSNLTRLMVESCKIRGDPMEALGKLSNLRILSLEQSESLDEGFVCENMFCDSKAFPKLRYLELSYFHSLKKWMVWEGAMPNLSDLKIIQCDGLEMIPDGFRFLTALKKLELSMPKSFNDRVRVIDGKKGVDFDKVSHVPCIDSYDRGPGGI